MRTVKHSERARGAEDRIDRRTCLVGVVGTVLALSARATLDAEPRSEPASALERWLRGGGAQTLGDPRQLARLGAAYLGSACRERDLRRLARRLTRDGSRPCSVQLIEHIARDWDAHHIVVVDGWVLSRTEARLCAMVHLLDGMPA